MVLRVADWKEQDHYMLNWLILLIAGTLLAIYLYQWWVEGTLFYLGLALVFTGWGIVYFTVYWQPLLYLVQAVIVSVVIVVWFLSDDWKQPIIKAAIVLNIVFVLLSLYLFDYEEPIFYPNQMEK